MANKNFIVKNGLEVGGQEVVSSSGVVTSAALGGQTLASTDSPTFNNLTLTNDIAVGGDINLTGDLNITGDVNTLSVTDLDVTDQTITLGKGQVESASGGSGIVIDGSGASILWDETNDEWDFNKKINVTGTISSGAITIGSSAVATPNAAADDFVIKGSGTAVGMTIAQDSDSGTGTIFFGDTTNSQGGGFRYNHNTGDMAISAEDFVNFNADGLQVGGTTFLDSSRNLTNIGTISSGVITADGLTVDTSTLVVDATNNRVGIGTSSPADTLHVGVGNIRIGGSTGNNYIYSTSSNLLGIQVNTGALAFLRNNGSDESMRIDSSGNVGIGTAAVTSPGLWYDATNDYLAISHWATPPTPAAMLHLSDNSNDVDVPQIRIEGRENPGDTKLDISVRDPVVRFNLIEGPGGDASNGYGLMEFKTNAAANASNPTRGGFKFITPADANNLVITNTGNVGIGIDNPASILTVDSGTANDAYSATGFNSESQIKIDVASTQNNYAGIQFTHSGNTEGFIGLVRPSATAADSDFVLQGYSYNKTAYTEYLRITDEGNLGLGTTTPTHSANYHTLDIRGTNGGQILAGRVAYQDFFMYTTSSAANIGALNDLSFKAGTNGSMTNPGVHLKANGNVGIGTSANISSPLTVQTDGSANSISIIGRNNGTNDEAVISFYEYDGTTRNAYIIKEAGNLGFATGTGGSATERLRINSSGQFFMNSNDGGANKVTAATTWSGAKFIVRETNGFIDMQSSGDSQTVGYRLGFRENTDLAGYIKYSTGPASMAIENNYTGASSQNEYSTIYFRNKNSSNQLKSRMRIGGANGYISTNPIGDAAQTSHQFEVQGGTSGTVFLSNNLAGYTVGVYPTIGTSGNDLHFQAANTYTGYISYNSGFVDVSDEREKENITTISNATAKLKQLRGVTHTWKDNRDDGATHLGLIAQEVNAVVPEVVSEGPTKPDETEPILGVHYGKLVPLLIESIKELEARITELEG